MDTLEITWQGGQHEVALTIGMLRALQDATGLGPLQIMMRFLDSSWQVDEVLHVIRFGLMGGGMAKAEAAKVIDNAYNGQNLMARREPAMEILSHALYGPEDDTTEKMTAGAEISPES